MEGTGREVMRAGREGTCLTALDFRIGVLEESRRWDVCIESTSLWSAGVRIGHRFLYIYAGNRILLYHMV